MMRFSTKELSPREIREQEERDAKAAASPPQGKKQNALAFLLEEKKVKKEDLKDDQVEFLKKLEAQKLANGDIALYAPGRKDPDMVVYKDGGIGCGRHGAPESLENIESLLKAETLFQSMNPGSKGYIYADNETSLMMMDYIARKDGAGVENPPPQKLEDVNPALAKKIDEQWAKMHPEAAATLRTATPQPAFQPVPAMVSTEQPVQSAIPAEPFGKDKPVYSGHGRDVRAELGFSQNGHMTFDQTTLQNSKVAQYLNGRDPAVTDLNELQAYIDKLKDSGEKFTDHDIAVISTLMTKDSADFKGNNGVVTQSDLLKMEALNKLMETVTLNAPQKEPDYSYLRNFPPQLDPNRDVLKNITEEDLKKTFDPDVFKSSRERPVKIAPILGIKEPKIWERLKEVDEQWWKNRPVVELQEESPKLSIAEGERGQISRSGLKAPPSVPDGLACKFEGCATGANLFGDPAQKQDLVAGLDQQQRQKPAPGGLAKG